MSTDTLTRPSQMKLAIAKADAPRFVKGRRAFFTYEDLGVAEGTNGRMRAQITASTQGFSKPTGWHYHVCDMQLVYMLEGWIDLEFAGTGVVRLVAGDSAMIPGGLPHQELRTSDSFRLLEVSCPADMGTEVCEPPPGASA
jgi:uncharacterized protein YjlB